MSGDDLRDADFPTEEMREFPNIVNVEVFRGKCPCRCGHCPVGIASKNGRFGDDEGGGIDLSLYGKIVDEMSSYPSSTLRIHSTGEPLLWEGLAQAVAMADERSVRSWLFTCGVTKDRSLLEAVCEHIDIVEVSVNSSTPDDYLATKGVGAFGLVADNIRHMRTVISGRHYMTRLIVSRVQSLDQAADAEFVRYWKETGLVEDAFVRTYHTYNDLLPKLIESGGEARHEPCLVHWARFNIGVVGDAVVCFNELFKDRVDPSLVYGNVRDQSIAEIWRGPDLAALRRAELTGDYSGLPNADSLPCRNCSSCQPLYGRRRTSEHQIVQLRRPEDGGA